MIDLCYLLFKQDCISMWLRSLIPEAVGEANQQWECLAFSNPSDLLSTMLFTISLAACLDSREDKREESWCVFVQSSFQGEFSFSFDLTAHCKKSLDFEVCYPEVSERGVIPFAVA